MLWRNDDPPRDSTPILIRSAACVSVATYSDAWNGWVAQADGHDARDANGDVIVIDRPDWWAPIEAIRFEFAD